MSSNRNEQIEKKISWLLAAILVIAITGTYLIEKDFHLKIEEFEKEGKNFYAYIVLIGCAVVLFFLSEKMIGIILKFILSWKKEELHGWWMYCFLFPATNLDVKKKFICFSVKTETINERGERIEKVEKKVLVVGHMEIYQDFLDLRIVKTATSKTLHKTSKNEWELCDRTTLDSKFMDFKDKDMIIIYDTSKTDYVESYRGIINLKTEIGKILIETPCKTNSGIFTKKNIYKPKVTKAYIGVIQDLDPTKLIVQSSIYSQQLRYEKDQDEVEEILKKNADNIINYILNMPGYDAELI